CSCSVSSRAICFLTKLSRAVFSSAPVACWKRRLNSSRRPSSSFWASSSSVRSWISLAFKEITLPFDELRAHGQLHGRQADRLACQRLRHPGQLEHDASGLDDGDVALRRSLARPHARFQRLLTHRLVREDRDPDLAATADLAR